MEEERRRLEIQHLRRRAAEHERIADNARAERDRAASADERRRWQNAVDLNERFASEDRADARQLEEEQASVSRWPDVPPWVGGPATDEGDDGVTRVGHPCRRGCRYLRRP